MIHLTNTLTCSSRRSSRQIAMFALFHRLAQGLGHPPRWFLHDQAESVAVAESQIRCNNVVAGVAVLEVWLSKVTLRLGA